MVEIIFKPIGHVRAQFSEADIRAEGVELVGELEIYPEFEPALAGIDGYSHVFVLAYFDRLRPEQIGPLQVKPRRLVNRGFKLEDLPLLGVFALDSPTRPNPIGLTLVRLLGRNGRFLKVSGLDFFDGTPILDIKGYRPTYRVDEFTVPDWYKKLQDARGHI
jgi:tRNA-Thr(GGU) m(6)t(6)A37 methyltransferase TsaA